jgi:hypothetical protein
MYRSHNNGRGQLDALLHKSQGLREMVWLDRHFGGGNSEFRNLNGCSNLAFWFESDSWQRPRFVYQFGSFRVKMTWCVAWSRSRHHRSRLVEYALVAYLCILTYLRWATTDEISEGLPVSLSRQMNVWPGSSLPGIRHPVCTRTVQALARRRSRRP